MQNPYQILCISVDADDAEIKQAYLTQIKNNPPDRNPLQFHRIADAYAAIKDKSSRLAYDLFTLPAVDFDGLLDRALTPNPPTSITPDQFDKLLRASLSDSTIMNVLLNTKQ